MKKQKGKDRNKDRNEKIRRNISSNEVFYSNKSYSAKTDAKSVYLGQKTKKYKVPNKKQDKTKRKENIIVVIVVSILFFMAFLILYRESMLDKQIKEINSVKEDIKKTEKENSQIELSFQSKLSLTNIEKSAAERLGMKKQSKDNTVYLKLDVEDFIEPVVVTKLEEEKHSFLKNIYNSFLDFFDKKKKKENTVQIKTEKVENTEKGKTNKENAKPKEDEKAKETNVKTENTPTKEK